MNRIGIFLITLCLLISHPLRAEEQQLTPEQQQYILEARNLLDSLNHQTGKVALPNGVASLDVPDSFYYLSPEDSEKVLVDVWGNLPGTGSQSLGMLLPSEVTPYDSNAWGVTIEYEEDGYVSDENADELDYNELLEQMKEGAEEESAQRVEQGYAPIELIGWASPPFYDKVSNKLHWAQEFKVGTNDTHTLNYNIRVLGRKGVLVLNFIAGMDQKSQIDSNLQTVLNMTEFNQGSRYEDFDPSIDKVAAYGIGALVAGKVIAKTGLIAAALIFLKKFGVIFLVGIGALFRKLFKKN